MKKLIIILFILVVIAVGTNKQNSILIPDESIRFRVIANSNSEIDQSLKFEIKEDVESEIYDILKPASNYQDAKQLLVNNINIIDRILQKYNISYDISYGQNYFPVKEYKGVEYPAGNYESLVITLGKGQGDNWWCVLFPPLCLLDSKDDINDIEYKSYVKTIINKFR